MLIAAGVSLSLGTARTRIYLEHRTYLYTHTRSEFHIYFSENLEFHSNTTEFTLVFSRSIFVTLFSVSKKPGSRYPRYGYLFSQPSIV